MKQTVVRFAEIAHEPRPLAVWSRLKRVDVTEGTGISPKRHRLILDDSHFTKKQVICFLFSILMCDRGGRSPPRYLGAPE